jgi:hypothetical protein
MPKRRILALAAALCCLTSRPADACRVLQLEFTPGSSLQVVVWLEDGAGKFVDTIFITRMTGVYGLGNRPGMMDFNSEWMWPYGRRESVFPIWAHRHGKTYPKLIFQNEKDDALSHLIEESSREPFYCRPLLTSEGEVSADTGTCATTNPVYTDKGKFSSETSLYPPRNDVTYDDAIDHRDVAMFGAVNDLDAVSRATPPAERPFSLMYAMPSDLPSGDYWVLIEVSKEYDQNAHYHYPSPPKIPYAQYGRAYRGQPSVLWKVPIKLDGKGHTELSRDYVGYGDPDGIDGQVNPPDQTVETLVEGSGAKRLLLMDSPEGMYRFRASLKPSEDGIAPATPQTPSVVDVAHNEATIRFVAPGDDGIEQTVTGYDVRYLAGEPMTEENFMTRGLSAAVQIVPRKAGSEQVFTIAGLMPETHYWVGIQAHDDCLNNSPIAVVEVTTVKAESQQVDACFVATAAWGSLMAKDVHILRRFRDAILRSQAVGEIFVEAYYTFGPAVARVIRPSKTLRALARAVLTPAVGLAKRSLRP